MAKGNDGSAARRRTTRKLLVAAGIALCLTVVIIFNDGSGSKAGSTVHHNKHSHGQDDGSYYDSEAGRGRGKRNKQQLPDEFRSGEGGRGRGYGRGRGRGRGYGRGRGRSDDESESADVTVHGHGLQKIRDWVGEARAGRGNGRYDIGADDERGHRGEYGGGFGTKKRKAENWKYGKNNGGQERPQQQQADDESSWFHGAVGGFFHGNANAAADVYDDDDVLAVQYRKDLIYGGQQNAQKAKSALEGILNGSMNLVDLDRGYHLKHSNDGSYQGVTGTFCHLDFEPHKKDPSKYPMFRFLVQNSPDCSHENKVSFDLEKVAYLARRRDQDNSKEGPKVLNITAVAFHESRCGSTLVANSMIAMDPRKHRSYSESTPPVKAFSICDDNFERCSQEQVASILKDAIYLMSRSDDHREERVFFKFQSSTSKKISSFQMAFPEVPWMYVYREPVQVMMSHVKDDPTMARTICTKTRRFPSREVHAIAKRHGRSGAEGLEAVEFCAAHLAELTESAVNNLNDMAIPVAYDQLPNMMWEKIMPKVFGRPLEQFEIDNMETISKSYSKGHLAKTGGAFKDDSEQKEKKASDEVRKAAKEFLTESFDQLAAFEPKLLK